MQGHFGVMIGRTDTIDTRNRSDNNGVFARKQRNCGGMAQTVNFIIDGGIFFDVSIGASDIGFRLVVIEIRNKIMHLVLGEKFTELGIELSGEGFIMSKNQSRLLNISNEVSHSKSLTRPRHTEQSLLTNPHLKTTGELSNCRRLITGGLEFTMKTKLWHTYILYNFWADYAKLRLS